MPYSPLTLRIRTVSTPPSGSASTSRMPHACVRLLTELERLGGDFGELGLIEIVLRNGRYDQRPRCFPLLAVLDDAPGFLVGGGSNGSGFFQDQRW